VIARNFLISFYVLLAGLTIGYFASRGASNMGYHNLYLDSKDGLYPIDPKKYDKDDSRLLESYSRFLTAFYHWIDRGDRVSQASYQVAMGQFQSMWKFHMQKPDKVVNSIPMNVSDIEAQLSISENTPGAIRWARVILVIIFFLLVLGIPGVVRQQGNRRFAGSLYFDTVFRPHRINSLSEYHGTRRLCIFLVTLYLLGFVVFSSFNSLLFPLVAGGLGLMYVVLLALLIHPGRDFIKVLVTLLAPRMMLTGMVMCIVAIRGPVFFWFRIWSSELFAGLFISLFTMFLFRKIHVSVVVVGKWSGKKGGASLTSVFLALGIQLLAAGLLLGLFGLEDSLEALNRDLLIFPGEISRSISMTARLGLPAGLARWMISFATGLIIWMLIRFYRMSGDASPRDDF